MPFQRAEFPFTSGVEEFIDKRQHMKLRAVTNLVWTKARQLRRRRGNVAMPTAGFVTPVVWGTSPANDLIALDGNNAYAFSSANSAWSRIGSLPAYKVSKFNTPLVSQAATLADPVFAVIGNYVCYAWMNAGIHAVVEDITSHQTLLSDQVQGIYQQGAAFNPHYPRVLAIGAKFYVFYSLDNGAPPYQINFFSIDTTGGAMTISVESTITTHDAPQAQVFDVVYDTVNGRTAIAYFETAGGTSNVECEMWNGVPSGVSAAHHVTNYYGVNGTAVPTAIGLAFAADGSTLYATWSDQPGTGGLSFDAWVQSFAASTLTQNYVALKYFTLTNSGTADGSIQNYLNMSQVSVVETNASTRECHVLLSAMTQHGQNPTFGFHVNTWAARINGSGAMVEGSYTPCLELTSRAFAVGGRCLMIGGVENAASYMLVDVTGSGGAGALADWPIATRVGSSTPLGMCSARSAFNLFRGQGAITAGILRVPGRLSDVCIVGGTYQSLVTTFQNNIPNPPLIWQLATFDPTWLLEAPANALTNYVAPSGFTYRLSPRYSTEICPLAAPMLESVVVQNTGGLSTGNYIFQACYALTLDDGNIIRGPFSAPGTVNCPNANNGVKIWYSSAPVGMFGRTSANVNIELYRSQVNQSVLYKTQVQNATTGGPILDTVSDVNAVLGLPAYWNGGGFANVNPGTSTIAIRNSDRIWLVAGDDQSTVYYSDSINLTTPPTFHDENTLYIEDGGAITGLAFLDDKLFVFKSDRIYFITGQPGNAAGFGSQLTAPQPVPSGGLGCVDQRTIVVTAEGIMFRSARGIELLDRSLQVTWIGAPVTDSLAAAGVMTGALLVPEQHQARFYLGTKTLIYDYVIHEWTSFDYGSINGAVLYGGRQLVQKGPLTAPWREAADSAGAFLDDGAYYSWSFTTDWKHLAQSGYWRLRKAMLLGEFASAEGVTIQERTDYDDIDTVASYAWADISTQPNVGNNKVVELEAYLVQPKCEAMSFVVSSTAPSFLDGGAGLYLNALSLEFKPMNRLHPRGPTSRG